MSSNPPTLWNQCLFALLRLYQLRLSKPELEFSEVDRLALLVTHKLYDRDYALIIDQILADAKNKFDDPIPF